MTLEQYANIFEVVGGAIVIVTLIFLVVQLRLLRDNFLSPGFELHWEQRKFILSREFQDFVEREVLSRAPTSG